MTTVTSEEHWKTKTFKIMSEDELCFFMLNWGKEFDVFGLLKIYNPTNNAWETLNTIQEKKKKWSYRSNFFYLLFIIIKY